MEAASILESSFQNAQNTSGLFGAQLPFGPDSCQSRTGDRVRVCLGEGWGLHIVQCIGCENGLSPPLETLVRAEATPGCIQERESASGAFGRLAQLPASKTKTRISRARVPSKVNPSAAQRVGQTPVSRPSLRRDVQGRTALTAPPLVPTS